MTSISQELLIAHKYINYISVYLPNNIGIFSHDTSQIYFSIP